MVGVAVRVGGQPPGKLDPVLIMELLRGGGFTVVAKKGAANGGLRETRFGRDLGFR